MKNIGVLSLQGGFEKHLGMVARCGARGVEIRYSRELHEVDGLILPGGESTTIGKLLDRNGFIPEIQKLLSKNFPVFGTCAGTILLADTIEGSTQVKIGGLPITIERNAYGSQVDSFESLLEIELSNPITFPGVFIRAPRITFLDDDPVFIRYNSIIAATFHPELTTNLAIHDYFIRNIV